MSWKRPSVAKNQPRPHWIRRSSAATSCCASSNMPIHETVVSLRMAGFAFDPGSEVSAGEANPKLFCTRREQKNSLCAINGASACGARAVQVDSRTDLYAYVPRKLPVDLAQTLRYG